MNEKEAQLLTSRALCGLVDTITADAEKSQCGWKEKLELVGMISRLVAGHVKVTSAVCTFNIEKYDSRLHLPKGRMGLSLIFLMKRFSPSTEVLVDAEAPGKSGAWLWLLILDMVLTKKLVERTFADFGVRFRSALFGGEERKWADSKCN